MSPVLSGRTPASSRRPRVVLAEVRVAGTILAVGVLLGVAWALWAPSLARSADPGESRIAVDGMLAVLGLAAGVVTAIVLVLAPGPRPALRLAVVLGAATAANILAAVVGLRLGIHVLGAPGVAVLWPLVTAVLTALRVLVSLVISPDADGKPPSPRHVGADHGEGNVHDGLSEPQQP